MVRKTKKRRQKKMKDQDCEFYFDEVPQHPNALYLPSPCASNGFFGLKKEINEWHAQAASFSRVKAQT